MVDSVVPGLKASPYALTVGDRVLFDPHPGKQLEVVQRIGARVLRGEGARYWFLRGNRGGGKSVTVRFLLHGLAASIPGFKYVVVRRNMPDLRLNHLQYLEPELEALGGTYHESHGICTYANGSKGFYRQCEDARDVEKVVGAEAAVLFVDEAPQIEWDHLMTMAPSVRIARAPDGSQPYYGAVVFSGNPVGASIDELDAHFLEQSVDPNVEPTYRPEDWAHIRIGLDDNPSLDPDEYRRSLGSVPPQFRAAWLDGERMESRLLFRVFPTITPKVRRDLGSGPRVTPLPEASLGRPYHYLQELPTLGDVPVLRVPWIQVHRAFDMGFHPDPAYALWLAVVGRRILAVRERVWFETIAKDIATSLIEETRELVGETPVVMTYVDPDIAIRSGVVTVMDEFEMAGVPCEPSVNDRVLYADAIHSLLGEELEPGVPRFQVYEPGCPLLAKYLPKMRWDEKNPRKMADHKFDHPVVTLAYFAISSGVLSLSQAPKDGPESPAWMSWIREAREGQRRRR